jgi:hypothetical protein
MVAPFDLDSKRDKAFLTSVCSSQPQPSLTDRAGFTIAMRYLGILALSTGSICYFAHVHHIQYHDEIFFQKESRRIIKSMTEPAIAAIGMIDKAIL